MEGWGGWEAPPILAGVIKKEVDAVVGMLRIESRNYYSMGPTIALLGLELGGGAAEKHPFSLSSSRVGRKQSGLGGGHPGSIEALRRQGSSQLMRKDGSSLIGLPGFNSWMDRSDSR